jgi:hypothetical protein
LQEGIVGQWQGPVEGCLKTGLDSRFRVNDGG